MGSTDSELAFCWLLQDPTSRTPVPSVELTHTLPTGTQIARHGTFNFLLSTRPGPVVPRQHQALHYIAAPASVSPMCARDEDVSVDLSGFNGPDDRLVIVVTEPLPTTGNWVPWAPGELLAFGTVPWTARACYRPIGSGRLGFLRGKGGARQRAGPGKAISRPDYTLRGRPPAHRQNIAATSNPV